MDERKGGEVPRPDQVGTLPVERFLAAIVAHEIGNPFTALLGRLELMEVRKGMPDTVRRDLEAMRVAGDRMALILENLKNFARGDVNRPGDLELASVVSRAVERLRRARPDLDLRVNLPPAGRRVQGDGALLEEVLVTSLAAMASRGGSLRRMEVSWGEDPEVEELSLVTRDDGRPLTDEEIARVFHPFSGGGPSDWRGLVTLSYGYYIIRGWGGTYRFPRTDEPTMELGFVALT